MRIAIDAMGGDHAPDANLEASLAAAREWPDTEILLVGPADLLRGRLGDGLPDNLRIVDAKDVIAADEEPVRAVRRKPDSSMVVAGRLVKEGAADAMVSSGNTGALMVTGLLVVGRLPGIDRPGLAPMLPSLDDVGVLALDLGANMDARPEHLLQYAIMGTIYREKVHGIPRPRVGLLNVGTEPGKGNEVAKAAYELLEKAPIHFVGNVEARDVLLRNCDVLVCDGFNGNILLKAMEGAVGVFTRMLRDELNSSVKNRLAALLLRSSFRKVRKKLDHQEYNGAPLLGVDGLVFKSHGSSGARAVKNAIRHAREAVRNGLLEALGGEFGKGG